jgi:hypothetical protein
MGTRNATTTLPYWQWQTMVLHACCWKKNKKNSFTKSKLYTCERTHLEASKPEKDKMTSAKNIHRYERTNRRWRGSASVSSTKDRRDHRQDAYDHPDACRNDPNQQPTGWDGIIDLARFFDKTRRTCNSFPSGEPLSSPKPLVEPCFYMDPYLGLF